MLRILNTEPSGFNPAARAILESFAEVVERQVTPGELRNLLPDFDILIVRLGIQIDRPIIEAGPRLRVIASATTGLDHIDTEFARSRGIHVVSLQGETEFLRTIWATAEHTWGLLLALIRHLPEAAESVRAGEWDRERFRGNELFGRRLGILGFGRIGEKIARYGIAFGMDVAAFTPQERHWPAEVRRLSSMIELFGRSDILSIHVPLNASTHHLVGKKEIGALPEGAILVNTSRSAVLDEGALLEALHSGKLAGAALDVIGDEREPSKRRTSPLSDYSKQHRNLLITPHLGGATFESMAATELFIAQRLREWCGRASQL